MAMRLRQIALVARDLEAVATDIAEVLGLEIAFRDPAVASFGLVNVVLPVGDGFLEVVSPREPGTTAGRLLDKRGGDGGYMVILQMEDIAAARALAEACHVRVVASADRDGVWMTHLHPRDVGGAILSLDAMDPPERWDWGGPDWQAHVRTEVTLALTGVELQGPDPEALARRWGEVLGLPVQSREDGFELAMDRSSIRFVLARDERGEGVSALEVLVRDRAEVMGRARSRGCLDGQGQVVLGGTRIDLVLA